MAPTRQVTSQDGAKLTVNDFLNEPLAVQARVLQLADEMMVANKLLRDAGGNDSGVVKYYQTSPLFADEDPADVAEGADIKVIMTKRGALTLSHTRKKAFGLRVTEEARRRNKLDEFDRVLTLAGNSMAQAWDTVFFDALISSIPAAHQAAATATWDSATTYVRKDILSAVNSIQTRQLSTGVASASGDIYGFRPNTIVIPTDDVSVLLSNDDVWKAYRGGNVADRNPEITGTMIDPIFGYDVYQTNSKRLPSGYALVLERGTVGFLSDEVGTTTDAFEYNRDNQTHRANMYRESAVGIDQPLAAALIYGTVS